MISNPILKGFHPDPSIIRVGDEYYIATSTFEWWPGVRLHHSKDLKNWELIEYPLNRVSQLDLIRKTGVFATFWQEWALIAVFPKPHSKKNDVLSHGGRNRS